MQYTTDQEKFWAGEFGNNYIDRNVGDQLLGYNLRFFSAATQRAVGVRSVLELGANVGMNLAAMKLLDPSQEQHAVEINERAADQLERNLRGTTVHRASILDFDPPRQYDLVLIKTVLIHINPQALHRVYDLMARASARYVLIAEYYSQSPTEVSYRGHTERLFKRDFAGEMLQRHPEFALRDYGFAYRNDPIAPQDDISWFLLEK